MASTSPVASAKTQAAEVAAAKAKSIEQPQVQVPGVSRREFLYYAWAASLALLTAQGAGILIWFGLPRFREGEFGGTFTVNAVPLEVGADPFDNAQGKFWLTNSSQGVIALYKVCTHLGCLFKWVPANGRFECPCHGSKFDLAGTWIEGPATRSLDRFFMSVETTSGSVLESNATGDPIPVAATDVVSIRVDTGKRIKRAGRV